VLSEQQKALVREELAAGVSVAAIARKLGISRQTVMRVRQ
jgi:putative DNA-invertase from lambdoid prophage Rac